MQQTDLNNFFFFLATKSDKASSYGIVRVASAALPLKKEARS
jgi:hypothetical protein